jgi:hypothetical protein
MRDDVTDNSPEAPPDSSQDGPVRRNGGTTDEAVPYAIDNKQREKGAGKIRGRGLIKRTPERIPRRPRFLGTQSLADAQFFIEYSENTILQPSVAEIRRPEKYAVTVISSDTLRTV